MCEIGSVVESVVRLAHCPVLTIPAVGSEVEATDAAAITPCLSIVAACGSHTEELICEPCRTRIRGEMLEHKLEDERAGRRGLSA
jgi:hypothetical protein